MFGRERIEAFLFEDLSKDAVGASQNIFRFLGVDDAFEPDTSLRHNVLGIPRSRALLGLVKTPNAVESFLKPLLPEGTRKRLSVNVQDWNLNKAAPLPEEARRGFAQTCR